MTTEAKIREAFEKVKPLTENLSQFMCFRAGYLSLLNELEFGGYNTTPQDMLMHKVYRLPEGVTKCY